MTTTPTDTHLLEQEEFGPYLVYERLGVGGMATVHRAREHGIEGFERIVALKRLLPHLAEDASFVKAFVREAKLASMLRHANIVQLYELGRVGTTYFISMEYIDGRDVRRILRHARKVTGPPTINVTLALLLQLCDALDYAHTRIDDDTGEPLRLVHRDVSPSNLLVTRSGHLKVIDFGIAKAQASHLRTATGRVKGKLAYMAPEAIAGKELDARSDVFSVGVIAHELLTARPLFASKNEYQTLLKVQKGEVLPPSTFNQACPPELDAIVAKALSKDPETRWSSAAEMRDALHEVRIRYHVSATNREVASWCDWAFSVEAPANNFSGPLMTDSMAGTGAQSGSRSPLALPLQAPHTEDRNLDAVPQLAAPARRPGSRAGSGAPEDLDEAADVAWGGAQEHDSGKPVVLEDVPDHSGRVRSRAPSVAGALAAAADAPAPEWQKTLVGAGVPATRRQTQQGIGVVAPSTFPYGSSDDAVPADRRRRSSSGPAVGAADTTDPTPLEDAPAFGAHLLEQRRGARMRLAIAGVLVLGAVAAGLYVTVGKGTSASTRGEPTAPAAPQTGRLKFIVEPSDAIVRIAGIPPHTGSDWQVELEAGVQQVEIARDGYKSWVTSIELSPGELQTVRVVLEASGDATVATLTVATEQAGITVLLDGRDVGHTPFSMEVPPGTHTVSLRESGVVLWRETFDAQANTKYEFNPSLSELKRREREARAARVVPEDRRAAPARVDPAAPATAEAPAPRVTTKVPPPGAAGAAADDALDAAPPARVAAPAPTPAPAAKAPAVTAAPPKPVPTPPARKAAPTGPVTIPPNAVKRVSGELGRIKAVIRDGETLPSTLAVKVCIDASGKVTSASVMTKTSPDLASRLAGEIRRFRYSPYTQAGAPVPACFAETFRLK